VRYAFLIPLIALAPSAFAQSAGEVERCFQNPAACSTSAPTPAAPPAGGGGGVAHRPAAAPDYNSVLQSAEADRRRIQESLRTLDKYGGPIDGNLQSDGTVKGISDWQKGRGAAATGKLTPEEVPILHAEASKAPIKRVDPSSIATAAPSNADQLKALQARLAERRKAAEPKANAAAEGLVKDLKAYVAADGKGEVGDQFASFATWYRETRSAGRSVGDITSTIDDYGDAKSGAATAVEVRLDVKQGDKSAAQCLVFAWQESNAPPKRRQTQAFSCDDVAAVEKWKSEQSLRSAWR
jgi:hypothetical protein